MDPDRRLQIEDPFHSALERKPTDRDKFPANASEDDTELRTELQAPLSDKQRAATILDKPTVRPASNVAVENRERQPRLERGRRFTDSRPPWWMYLVAAPFLAKAIYVTAFCFFGPESMGIEIRPTKAQPVVSGILQNSPAERAGIRPGDVLVRADGRPILGTNYWYWFVSNLAIGRPVVLETDRRGRPLRTVLVLKRRPPRYWSTGEGLLLLLHLFGQFSALAVAFFMAFMRSGSLLACIGALLWRSTLLRCSHPTMACFRCGATGHSGINSSSGPQTS
jgi:PDZ domain-containing protein